MIAYSENIFYKIIEREKSKLKPREGIYTWVVSFESYGIRVTVLSLQGGTKTGLNREADDRAKTHIEKHFCPGVYTWKENSLWRFRSIFIGSVTAAPKSILRADELRYGPLRVHRPCLGCFESDSEKKFRPPVIDFFKNLRAKNRDLSNV